MEMSELLDGRRKTGGHVCVQVRFFGQEYLSFKEESIRHPKFA